jgi:hypothetical protein
VAPSRADLNSEAICKARHQIVFTKTGSNVASGSISDRPRDGRFQGLKCYTSVCSEISSASSTSMPRYRTVLSSFVWPSSNCTARRFFVRR